MGRTSPALLKCSLHRLTQSHWCWVSDMTGPCPPTGVLSSLDGKGMIAVLSAFDGDESRKKEGSPRLTPERQGKVRSVLESEVECRAALLGTLIGKQEKGKIQRTRR